MATDQLPEKQEKTQDISVHPNVGHFMNKYAQMVAELQQKRQNH